MTAQFIAASTRQQSAGATNLTVALPSITGAQLGVLLAVVTHASNETLTTAQPGWTKLYQSNSGVSFTMAVFIAAPGVSAPNVAATSSLAMSAQCFYFEDADNAMIANAAGSTSVNSGSSSPHSSVSVNTLGALSLMVLVDVARDNTALTAPAGWSLVSDVGSAVDAGRTSVAVKLMGAIGSASGDVNTPGANTAWIQRQIELRLVAAAAGDQFNTTEAVLVTASDAGIGLAAMDAALMLSSGDGIGLAAMEICCVLGPREPDPIRDWVGIFC